jgi:hypothetical protein
MYNSEILSNIIKKFDIEKAAIFCECAALMYDIKYNACKDIHCLTEYDFERDWWSQAYIELTKEINL